MTSFKFFIVLITFPILLSINSDCKEILPLNEGIISFVNSKMDKKVGTGECWDLASEALNLVKAKWDGKYVFGKVLNYKTDCIYPGDIIQFEKVKVKYTENKMTYEEAMPHHTAIIYTVNGIGDYMLAHQNTAYTGRKVGKSKLLLSNITTGKFIIYRPVKE